MGKAHFEILQAHLWGSYGAEGAAKILTYFINILSEGISWTRHFVKFGRPILRPSVQKCACQFRDVPGIGDITVPGFWGPYL